MLGYIEGMDRGQATLFPDRLEDWIGEDNPVRVIDLFVDERSTLRGWDLGARFRQRRVGLVIIRRCC